MVTPSSEYITWAANALPVQSTQGRLPTDPFGRAWVGSLQSTSVTQYPQPGGLGRVEAAAEVKLWGGAHN